LSSLWKGRPRLSSISWAAAVVDQSCVQELDTVVDVQPQEGEGQLPVEASDAGENLSLALGHDRQQLAPAGFQVGGGERVDPIAGGPGAAVGDEIDLQVAGASGLAPVADPDGHLAAQPAGRSQAALWPADLLPKLSQVPGDGGGAGGEQQGFGLGWGRELAVLFEQLQQVGQEGP
jgi:hypothetical protein